MHWAIAILVATHLLAVNLAGAGPLVAVWLEWRGTRGNRSELNSAAGDLARCALVAAGIGIALGILALASVTMPDAAGARNDYTLALKQVTPDRFWFTIGEVVFYLVCISGYLWLLSRRPQWRIVHRTLGIAAGTNLLYHFPALFTILAIVPTRPALIGIPLDRAVYHKLLLDPETMARVVHVWLASFAVTGLTLSWIGRRRIRGSENSSVSAPAVFGSRLALVATLMQIPIGIWVLTTLPNGQQDRLLGGDGVCTAIFAVSIVASFALLHQLALLALGDASRNRLVAATILMISVVLLMTAALLSARS